jgi:excisionase family DNA binding protein
MPLYTSNPPEAIGVRLPAMLLTPRDAAKALAICEKTLWSLTQRGELQAVKIGRSVRYDPRDLAAFIDAKKGGAR